MVINRDDGTGEAAAFAEQVGIPVLSAIPANDDIRRKSASYEIIGRPDSPWGPMFAELAENVGTSPPMRPKPMTQDELLGLFSAAPSAATWCSSRPRSSTCAARPKSMKQTLEVVYDEV